MLKQDLILQILKIYRLPKGKKKNVIGLMKDELSGHIMKEFLGLRSKTYSYLKTTMRIVKCKRHKNGVIKRKF